MKLNYLNPLRYCNLFTLAVLLALASLLVFGDSVTRTWAAFFGLLHFFAK
jgi:uncharacterized BrkB/YihY/UPF0761 family membrane protein